MRSLFVKPASNAGPVVMRSTLKDRSKTGIPSLFSSSMTSELKVKRRGSHQHRIISVSGPDKSKSVFAMSGTRSAVYVKSAPMMTSYALLPWDPRPTSGALDAGLSPCQRPLLNMQHKMYWPGY